MIEKKKIEVDGETIYLSKTTSPIFPKWKVIYPIKNEDGSVNWKHLITGGSWSNILFVILFVLVFLGAAIEYNNSLKECAVAMKELNAWKINVSVVGLNHLTDNLNLVPNQNLSLEVQNTE